MTTFNCEIYLMNHVQKEQFQLEEQQKKTSQELDLLIPLEKRQTDLERTQLKMDIWYAIIETYIFCLSNFSFSIFLIFFNENCLSILHFWFHYMPK